MSDLSPTALKLTAAQEEKVSTMDRSDDIAEYLKEISVQNGLLKRDWDPSLFIPVAPGAAPRRFAKSITVDGQKRIFEADNELELERSVNDYFRSLHLNQETNSARQTDQPA